MINTMTESPGSMTESPGSMTESPGSMTESPGSLAGPAATRSADAPVVLAGVRELHQRELAASAGILQSAALWADAHPVLDGVTPATVWHRGVDEGCPLAGAGVPLVDADCIAEFAATLELTTESGQRLIGQALELRHRLPRLWRLVHDCVVPAWRARRVAERTILLSGEAAAFVDGQVAAVSGRIGPVQLDRLISATVERFMPAEAERRRSEVDPRHVRIEPCGTGDGIDGYCAVDAVVDLPDALDLDAALNAQARALGELGCEASHDARRAVALGDLARRQPTLDLSGDPAGAGREAIREPSTETAGPGRAGRGTAGQIPGVRARQIVLYLHLSDEAIRSGSGTGRVQNTGQPVTADAIRRWCGQSDTTITVKPVIDVNRRVSVDAYEVPDRIREHISLRDVTCVFPWCAHPVRSGDGDVGPSHATDCDHVIPYARGGATATDNLAALCRKHHRLKTRTGWRYTMFEPGAYLWMSPHGYLYLRDHTGTRSLGGAGFQASRPRAG